MDWNLFSLSLKFCLCPIMIFVTQPFTSTQPCEQIHTHTPLRLDEASLLSGSSTFVSLYEDLPLAGTLHSTPTSPPSFLSTWLIPAHSQSLTIAVIARKSVPTLKLSQVVSRSLGTTTPWAIWPILALYFNCCSLYTGTYK